jgi:hypothetical protein
MWQMILAGGLNFASTIANTVADYKAAVEDYETKVQQWKDETQERRRDYYLQSMMLSQQSQEVDTQTSAELLERKMAAQKEAARLKAAAGEAGIEGNTVGRLMTDVEQAAGRDTSTIKYNREIKQRQIYNAGRVAMERAKAPKLYAHAPNRNMYAMRMGLGIGSAAMGTYNQYAKK